MGLKPLEFKDCLTDSPFFRQDLYLHECALKNASESIKNLEQECKNLIDASHKLSKCQRSLARSLHDFRFETIGATQTDDERIIVNSLKEFARLVSEVEDRRQEILVEAERKYIEPLKRFRVDCIGSALQDKRKRFEKSSSRFYGTLEKHLNTSTAKKSDFKEADAALQLEQLNFFRSSMDYVYVVQTVQEKMKFEFAEILCDFIYEWMAFYHYGHEVHENFKSYLNDFKIKVQKARDNYDATQHEAERLKASYLHVRSAPPLPSPDSGHAVKQGYLLILSKRNLLPVWSKHYCLYQKESGIFSVIPISQSSQRDLKQFVNNSTAYRLKKCMRRASDSIERRFCFDLIVEGLNEPVTCQAASEEERRAWLDVLDGKEPVYSPTPAIPKNVEFALDERGFDFVRICIQEIEKRGLSEQGLYRHSGVSSKIQKLLHMGLDKGKLDKICWSDDVENETRTITSAVKQFLRCLSAPLMTYELHNKFISAAQASSEQRQQLIHSLVHQLPDKNRKMLEILIRHLRRVADKCTANLMTVGNLAVCFGPTLFREQEESIKAIMEIKFYNVIVEVLIEHCEQLFSTLPPNAKIARPPKPVHLTENGALSSMVALRNQNCYTYDSGLSSSSPTTSAQQAVSVVNPIYSSSAQAPIVPSRPRPIGMYSSSGDLPCKELENSSVESLCSGSEGAPAPRTQPQPHPTNHSDAPSPNLSQTSQHRMSHSYAPSYPGENSTSTPASGPQWHSGQPLGIHSNSTSGFVAYQPSQANNGGMVAGCYEGGGASSSPVISAVPPSRRVRTLFECIADHSSELSFLPGQIITNVFESKERGWMVGTLNGKTGLIPSNYVEPLA